MLASLSHPDFTGLLSLASEDHAVLTVGAWAGLIPLIPLVAALACGWLSFFPGKGRNKRPAMVCIAGLALSFLVSMAVVLTIGHGQGQVTLFEWIRTDHLKADFAFYLDPLTSIMLMVVTGIGTLVAVYASEYMWGDRGYARFFAFVSLFIAAMTCLVLADNLILMYLGWEGVGLCSYLLIGFYYEKPAAVAAAKKAFIVNRIGDLGFALGIMLTYLEFGSVEFDLIFQQIAAWRASGAEISTAVQTIPFLLLLGAIGKSAQLPLYVWLPDAMEGPTPVSALIHAATMVTAGVYLIARLLPLFLLSPYALPTVAWVGCLTAIFSATIAMAQHDIKRIFAYSTVSQLGYMFMGLGVLSSVGGTFHLFTHAFFKAALFLGSGAVMHGFAGQLDLRQLSGLWRVPGWRIVTASMFVACLALVGFPLTAGFFSKDMILAQAFVTPGPGFEAIGWIGLITAGLTAYYTFRVFFRVFMGPVHFKPGEDQHGAHDEHHFHPHAPGLSINFVLIVLGLGAVFAGWLGVGGESHGWFGGMVDASSASGRAVREGGHEAAGFFSNPHQWMMLASSVVGLLGIGIAAYLHLLNRPAAERWRRAILPIAVLAEHKWCVDEGYDLLIRRPLRVIGHVCYALGDTMIINGIVAMAGWIPRLIGAAVRPMQNGRLQGYGLGMAGGAAMLLIIVWWLL